MSEIKTHPSPTEVEAAAKHLRSLLHHGACIVAHSHMGEPYWEIGGRRTSAHSHNSNVSNEAKTAVLSEQGIHHLIKEHRIFEWGMMTTQEAAEQLGVPKRDVCALLDHKFLGGKLYWNDKWYICGEHVDRMKLAQEYLTGSDPMDKAEKGDVS